MPQIKLKLPQIRRGKSVHSALYLKSVSAAAEIGLMIGAAHLSEKGYKSAATCLFGLGAAGLICDLVFNRK